MELLSLQGNDATKIKNLQTFIWKQCMENIREHPDSIDRGWKTSTEGLFPLLYVCEVLPPSNTDKSQNIEIERSMFYN